MKKIVLLIIFISAVSSLRATDSLSTFKRTGIYSEIGIGDIAHANLNLEHYFLNKNYWHLGARTGYGQYGSWAGHGGGEVFLTLSGLLGKKYHYLELQTGGALLNEKVKVSGPMQSDKYAYSTSIYPFVSLGYTFRYGHFLFRANVNTLATVNGGLGFVF